MKKANGLYLTTPTSSSTTSTLIATEGQSPITLSSIRIKHVRMFIHGTQCYMKKAYGLYLTTPELGSPALSQNLFSVAKSY